MTVEINFRIEHPLLQLKLSYKKWTPSGHKKKDLELELAANTRM